MIWPTRLRSPSSQRDRPAAQLTLPSSISTHDQSVSHRNSLSLSLKHKLSLSLSQSPLLTSSPRPVPAQLQLTAWCLTGTDLTGLQCLVRTQRLAASPWPSERAPTSTSTSSELWKCTPMSLADGENPSSARLTVWPRRR